MLSDEFFSRITKSSALGIITNIHHTMAISKFDQEPPAKADAVAYRGPPLPDVLDDHVSHNI